MKKEKTAAKRKLSMKKALEDVQETLDDINIKMRELLELDKGSKAFAIAGWLIMSLSGATLITIGVLYSQIITSITGAITFFIIAMIAVMAMLSGYSLAHKGLTGDWM